LTLNGSSGYRRLTIVHPEDQHDAAVGPGPRRAERLDGTGELVEDTGRHAPPVRPTDPATSCTSDIGPARPIGRQWRLMSLTTGTPPRRSAAAAVLSRALQLLADEAPADELDALVGGAEPSGAPGELLQRALADARRIRTLLDRRARREREAQVLYETARDLTSLRDSDAVLRAIVERSRRLLACDSTYIALVDQASGDAYMRVTSGTRTRPIESVRQRPGYGVGGYVIQTGQPLATANYRTDPRIRRDPLVAAAVAEDDVVAIAGVPIKLGTSVVGALFAANRHERTFDRAEIAMLTSLADHASIVIENARLFERVQEASAELREANAQLRAQRQALERAGRAHEQLMPMALTRVGMPEFTRTLARILDGTVAVVASSGTVLAVATVPGAPPPPDVLSGRAEPPTTVRDVPVRAGAETFGRLLLGRSGPLAAVDARTLERAAQTAALLLLMERQTTLVTRELREELVEDLLAERLPDWTAFHRRARRLGVADFDRPHAVVVVTAPGVARRALVAAAADFAGSREGIAGEHGTAVVVLLPDVAPADAARAAAAELGHATGCAVTAGAAGPAVSACTVRALHRDAARCMRLLLALGRVGAGADIAEFGVLGMVLEDPSPEQVQNLLERTLGPLLTYDREHHARLAETARSYFANSQNPPTAARCLGLHVNTVYQRIDRIDHVLGGTEWRSPRGALEMQVALQLHQLLHQRRREGEA
jgi:GAF domain-containing protein